MCEFEYEHLNEKHAASLQELWGAPDVIRYTNIKKPCTFEETAERIQCLSVYEDVFAVRYENAIIGVMGCPAVDRAQFQFGVFYQFKKQYWNRGIASRTVDWLLKHMKKQYGRAELYADAVSENTASEKILKHFSFELISSAEDAFECNGTRMNVNQYKLIL